MTAHHNEGITAELWDNLQIYGSVLVDYANEARIFINQCAADLEPWQVAAYTFSITCFCIWVRSVTTSERPFVGRLKHFFFKVLRKVPWVEAKIHRELTKVRADLDEVVHKSDPKREFLKFLPDKPLPFDELMNEIDKYDKMSPYKVTDGRISGAVYTDMPQQLIEVQKRVFELFAYSNPLHPDVFPGARKMEAEVVRMVCNLFNGGADSCGAITVGGTESILLSMLAYRNRAYDMGIDHPEMVVPYTAHAAFDKAAHYFRIRIRHAECDQDTMQVNVAAMKRLINGNTCVIVGSAPNFPYGNIDPLNEISQLGQSYNIPVHVDACLGGFLLPFMEQLGYAIGPYDFRLPGVMSISCDTHKYGFAPKGSSVVMYRSESLRHYQYFAQVDWPGGMYASPTLAGSRAGLSLALTWATMLYFGKDGYKQATEQIIQTTQYIRDTLEDIEAINLLGTSEMSVIAIASDVFNVYALMDELGSRGWNLNSLQHPPAFHLCVTVNHTKPGVADQFISDVKELTAKLAAAPNIGVSKTASMYGASAQIPDRGLVAECAFAFLDACYSTWSPQRDFSRRQSRTDAMFYGRAHSMADDGVAMQTVLNKLQKLSEDE